MSNNIHYRAVHARTLWRKSRGHRSLAAAIRGKDGAAGLFARTVRVDYQRHGDPLFVIVWETGATAATLIAPDPAAGNGVREMAIPVDHAWAYERAGAAPVAELARWMASAR